MMQNPLQVRRKQTCGVSTCGGKSPWSGSKRKEVSSLTTPDGAGDELPVMPYQSMRRQRPGCLWKNLANALSGLPPGLCIFRIVYMALRCQCDEGRRDEEMRWCCYELLVQQQHHAVEETKLVNTDARHTGNADTGFCTLRMVMTLLRLRA